MLITIINTLPVPSGEASVNRILSYSKGLVKEGNNVCILSSGYLPSGRDNIIDGVKACNLGSNTAKPLSLFISLVKILKRVLQSKTEVVVLVSNSLFLIYPLYLVCKIRRIKFIQEKSEFPFSMMKKGVIQRLYSKFYINTTYKLFDGLIVMTKPLMEFYKGLTRNDCLFFEMPMTVDIERFEGIKEEPNLLGEYMAYCGNLSNKKDGILNLIEAFSFVAPLYPQLKLILIGGSSDNKDLDVYKERITELALNNVILYGRVDRNDMPSLLKNAKALLLARPSSLQSSGGFPTKLGEYLATGNPVVVTAVGDIPLYLNSSNSFIVEPDNNQAFAEKILEIMKDEERAREIGKAGQSLAKTVFNAKIQSHNLNNYLRSL